MDGPLPVVNAAGTLTWLGGAPLNERVIEAMTRAAESTWDMAELHLWAGEHLARLLGVPGVLVTAGASAAMTLSAAAIIAGSDYEAMAELPRPRRAAKLLIQRSHRTAYDRAWTAAGAVFQEFGYAGPPGTGATQPWELQRALEDPEVIGVAFSLLPNVVGLDLAAVTELAHGRHRPVVVDAAACLPPIGRLLEVVRTGADLIAVSGGKALGGPQNSGLLVGSPTRLKSALLQMLDQDVDADRFATWFEAPLLGQPHHGIGRGLKVSKEAIFGLVAAVQHFVEDYDDIAGRWGAILDQWETVLKRAGVPTERDDAAWGGPTLRLQLGRERGRRIADLLRRGTPRIEVGRHYLEAGVITLSSLALREADGAVVAEALKGAVLSG